MQRLPLSYYLYRLLMMLMSPILLIWSWRTSENASQRSARLGKINTPITADIWLHCASVGEVNAVMPLVTVLLKQNKTIFITCFTPTGLAQAQRRLNDLGADHVTCVLLPIDWHWTMSRLLSQVTVSELWLIETEFWPTLIITAKQHGIRIKLVNGRLSSKTLKSPTWWRNLLAYLLTYQIGTCLLRSEQDKTYYTELGVMPEKLQVTGNIKLCDELKPNITRLYPHEYIVFASTHTPEEETIARIWQANPTLPKLVIVPRHPKRGHSIAKDFFKAGILFSQRSQHPEQHKGILIADTFGELTTWMAFAELVIIGGSFAPKGGQNPIEPARLGRYIITGPDMHDFADETQALKQVGALEQFPTIDETLITHIKMLLKHPERLTQYGQAGHDWLISTQNIVMTSTLNALFPTTTTTRSADERQQ